MFSVEVLQCEVHSIDDGAGCDRRTGKLVKVAAFTPDGTITLPLVTGAGAAELAIATGGGTCTATSAAPTVASRPSTAGEMTVPASMTVSAPAST